MSATTTNPLIPAQAGTQAFFKTVILGLVPRTHTRGMLRTSIARAEIMGPRHKAWDP